MNKPAGPVVAVAPEDRSPPGDRRQADEPASQTAGHLKDLPSAEGPSAALELVVRSAMLRVSIVGSFVILLIGAVYLAKEILLPIALAFLLTLTLSPVVRFLARYRIPEAVSSLAIVLAVVGGTATGGYYLSGPVSGWLDGAPRIGSQIRTKIASFRVPVDAAVSASKQVEAMTSSTDPDVQKVVIQQPGLLAQAAGGAVSMFTTAGITIVLLFFLLASGRLFYEKLVRVLPTMKEKKRAIRVVHAVEEEISAYLLTITLINTGMGIAIGTIMWALGMPNPILWGVMAAALTYIPYVGAVVGIGIVAIVALVSFDSPTTALLAPGLYFICAVIEGQFLTPTLLGRRLEMNAVAVFLAVAVGGWFWGVPGALMAVPFLVSVRVLCDHFEDLSPLGEFLSGRPAEEPEPAEAPDLTPASGGARIKGPT